MTFVTELHTFNQQRFLDEYWQQKPCVIRGLLPDFTDPIDEHDLAGLAQEPDVDSRIVSRNRDNTWQLHQGPFESFEAVCVDQWSLLVQGTDRFVPELNELMEAFKFIPYWRMDDLMVSYSVPGAGVGAHIDQYDVFLIQGKGSRQWQVGKPNNQAEFDNQGLLQVDDFEPCIDVVVKPGDVLYIPPGWPHKGETVEAALTYSVGFRAPDTEFIAGALQDFLIQQPGYNQRFSDPKPNYKGHFAQVSSTAIEQLKQMLSDCMSSPQFTQHLTAALSQQNLTDEAQEIAEISKQEILDAMQNGDFLHRREGLRPLFSEIDHGDHWLYLDGEAIKIGAMMWPIVLPLVEFTSIQLTDDLPEDMLDPYAALVQFLVERQWWYLED